MNSYTSAKRILANCSNNLDGFNLGKSHGYLQNSFYAKFVPFS